MRAANLSNSMYYAYFNLNNYLYMCINIKKRLNNSKREIYSVGILLFIYNAIIKIQQHFNIFSLIGAYIKN